ncbi:MAG: dicarboxylate/amino acid:cation symporter [Cytophagales bacterium]|nr:dicarboxylate/amino acid:cation symporter [Cytophagales bacterium]
MKKIAIHWKILIGLVLGIIWGLAAISFGWTEFTKLWIKPFGTIFINLLMLIAVPLVLASLIKGVSSLSDVAKLSRIGGKTIGLYLVTTVVAVGIGLLLVNTIRPGDTFSEEKKEQLKEQYASKAFEKQQTADQYKERGPLDFFVDIVPKNIFFSFQDNKNMLQVIFFAILFGFALVLIPENKAGPVIDFFDGVFEAIIKVVEIVMKAAPIGVFALLAGIIVDFSGDVLELLTALLIYSFTVIIGLVFLAYILYPSVLRVFTKMKYGTFFKGIIPAQLVAFSTSSSAATLPVTMKQCEEDLGVSKEITSFALPLGATINMDGTSLYQSIAAVFIAQAFGHDLTIAHQLTIVLTATLASIGAAAVPGAGTVMLVIVLQAIGIDPAGIALIFAMDRPLDMCRTVVNITGDATVASIVASTEGQLDINKSS